MLGTGSIARTVVGANSGAFAAVGNRNADKAATCGLEHSFGAYEELLACESVGEALIDSARR